MELHSNHFYEIYCSLTSEQTVVEHVEKSTAAVQKSLRTGPPIAARRHVRSLTVPGLISPVFFVISLRKRKDRLRAFAHRWAQTGFNFQPWWFPAVEIHSNRTEVMKHFLPPTLIRQPTNYGMPPNVVRRHRICGKIKWTRRFTRKISRHLVIMAAI